MDWYEKAELEIDVAYENGEIDIHEHRKLMRDLQAEYRGMAEEAAQRAYDDYL